METYPPCMGFYAASCRNTGCSGGMEPAGFQPKRPETFDPVVIILYRSCVTTDNIESWVFPPGVPKYHSSFDVVNHG